MVAAIQNTVYRAVEWSGTADFWMVCPDIKRACDNYAPKAVKRCLEFWSVPPFLSRALVEEALGFRFDAHLQGTSMGEFLMFCNLLVHTVLADVVHEWELLGHTSCGLTTSRLQPRVRMNCNVLSSKHAQK
jgi:hypothetical protein